jgi:hypothetical protein
LPQDEPDEQHRPDERDPAASGGRSVVRGALIGAIKHIVAAQDRDQRPRAEAGE